MPKSFDQFVTSDRLPSLPQIALRVIELAREPEPDFGEVIRTVRADPAISSKILRTANSALFGLNQTVKSVETAIPLLGITLVRTLVLGFTLATQRPDGGNTERSLQKLWRSCLTQAVFAESLAMDIAGADPPTYFLAGLLQDIGILAALHVDPQDYLTHVWETSEFPNVIASERQYYGFTHIDLMRELCGRWGIPPEMRDAMAAHHNRMQTASGCARSLATALQAANLGAQYLENIHKPGHRHFDDLVVFLTQHYDWPLEKTEDALREIIMRVGETAVLYAVDVGNGYSTEQILSDAKQILEEIAIHSQLQSLAPAKDQSGMRKFPRRGSLEEELMRDAMTGAYNRRFMDQVLNERLAHHIRRQQSIGFLFVDIDRFKRINDEYGHQAGDEAIRQAAKVLSDNVRTSDFVIRYGGDEFLIALMNVNNDAVQDIAERICREVRSAQLKQGEAARMTTSIGAIHYQPCDGDPLDANWLIDHVDKAMYEAKRDGGDNVRFYHVLGKNPLAVADLPPAT